MSEWNDPVKALPAEGELVEVRLPGGKRIKPVEFSSGRFWKARKGTGGHAYVVEAWRALGISRRGKNGSTESAD